VRRRTAEGTLNASQVPTILKRFTVDRAFWTFIEVSREVLAGAETLTAASALAMTTRHVES
jgi:hypothetical protein